MSGGQQQTTHDNAIGWLILGGVFLALFILFWYFFENQVKSGYRWIRWSEMWVISIFVDEDYTVEWVDPSGKAWPLNFYEYLDIIPTIPAEDLNGPTLALISTLAMGPLKIPLSLVLGLMAIWAIAVGPGTQYRRKMGLDGLIGAQAGTFPVVKPFVKFNPATLPPRPPGAPVPAELPIFAEALGPEEWIAYNQIPVPDGNLDQGAAYKAFARQLGPRWQGAMKLAPYKQVLLAAFCLKSVRKRNDADEMMGRLAQCWTSERGLNLKKDKKLLKQARKILKSRSISEKCLANCNQHAFQTTALLRALQTAREEGGVMAPAQFVWLRAYDRTLWYPLNNLGRQAYHMEALGAMCHFKAEKITQRPIPRPKLDDAVGSISEYMSSERARPIPQLDYSGSKKRGIKKPKGGIKKPKK
jgi:intracellular multiplication protein IcmP